jgi:hypothetical protein
MASTGPTPPAASHASKARLLRQAAATTTLWIPARGASMGRAVPSGSSVLVAPYAPPRRGEVWAYCDESGTVVVHRYRRQRDTGHLLQGDTSASSDAPVRDEQLIGRVVAVRVDGRVRGLGRLDRWLGDSRRTSRALVARALRMTRRRRAT